MQLSNVSELADRGRKMEEIERYCPECGAAMVEFDRLTEDAAVFTWYACTREGCTGQWLTKRAMRMCGA